MCGTDQGNSLLHYFLTYCLLFCIAALFTVNVSFDVASTVIVEVAFLASTQVFENLSKCWGFHYTLFIITLSTLNKFISKALLENDKKHDNLFPCPFITLEMPQKIENPFIFIKRHVAFCFTKKKTMREWEILIWDAVVIEGLCVWGIWVENLCICSSKIRTF